MKADDEVIWHDVENGGLRRGPRDVASPCRRAPGRDPRPRLRHRPGRPPPREAWPPRLRRRQPAAPSGGAPPSRLGEQPCSRRDRGRHSQAGSERAALQPGAGADAGSAAARRWRRADRGDARGSGEPRAGWAARGRRRRGGTGRVVGAERPPRSPTSARRTAGSTRACRSQSTARTAESWSSGCGRSSAPRASSPRSRIESSWPWSTRPGSRPRAGRRLRACRARRGRTRTSATPPRRSFCCGRGRQMMELRVLALYPEQMNIYADRGNILFLQRRCEWRGIGFSYAAAGPGDDIDPAAHDLDLHRRWPGPRPAARRRRPGRDEARAARGRGRRRRRAAGRLRRLPAPRPLLPARRRADRGARAGRPRDRSRGGPDG